MTSQRTAGLNGASIAALLTGGAFVYSGVTGGGLANTVRGFLTGAPPAFQNFPGIAVDPTTGTTVGTGSNVVVSAAASQLGKPYAFGMPHSASDPNPASFDCSGFTMWCYNKAGVKLPHNAAAQYATMKHRPISQVQIGDLMFLRAGADIHHVMLYIGNGAVIEAPDYGIPVRQRGVSASDAEMMQTVGVFPGGVTQTDRNALNATGTGGTPATNKAIGVALAASYGWTGSEFTSLNKLWTRESGWSNTAKNPSSGAYGIAQALPESKYPPAGRESGGSSSAAQISWGLAYIKSRYGTPSAAWAHETTMGWY